MAQMILFSIAPDALMGLSNEFTDSAKAYTDEKYWNLPVFGTFYGKNVSLNLEALLAASPQVIIDIGEAKGTIAEDMDGIQAQTGIPTIFIECSLENTGAAYRLSLIHIFMELRAFLPFLTVHTENAAMIHDFLRVKYHTPVSYTHLVAPDRA